ncbi:MAG: NUDIX domain-containing protein [Caldilineaceae bacterium SB0670_bin_27]|uniref:NUDIX domain-containing protein n=1 Tax=Caldilineaceae bacterium SB0664_bin_27 TaxID=2605260 RepID=A0A6B0YTE6_9CHLR|nr:NUDIX domain-containing protein [Caldilineaceae bacterium SB0664_bin_27]MYJ77659.1 NUDIX domain-containing protein [Caldilineaceae bacterium SB0670_bin_27]
MKSQRDDVQKEKRFSGHKDQGNFERPADQRGNGTEQPDGYTVRHIHSAGGVAFRLRDVSASRVVQVALIATDKECRRWQLPKGRLYPSEEPLTAALREVEEETGLETEFESFLKTVRYEYLDTYARAVPERVYKKVDFYLLRVVGGILSDASVEVRKVEWASPDDALGRLTYDGERDCVKLALEYLNGY